MVIYLRCTVYCSLQYYLAVYGVGDLVWAECLICKRCIVRFLHLVVSEVMIYAELVTLKLWFDEQNVTSL